MGITYGKIKLINQNIGIFIIIIILRISIARRLKKNTHIQKYHGNEYIKKRTIN